MPVLVHEALRRVGRAGPLGRRFLVLTTIGRRTGRPRSSGLNYVRDGDAVYVASGYGRTDWLRNIEGDPRVMVAIGQRRWIGLAREVTDPAERRRVLDRAQREGAEQGPPRAVRPLLRRIGLDYDAELRRLADPELDLPVVALRPLMEGAAGSSVRA